jgi:hypothetical protein
MIHITSSRDTTPAARKIRSMAALRLIFSPEFEMIHHSCSESRPGTVVVLPAKKFRNFVPGLKILLTGGEGIVP